MDYGKYVVIIDMCKLVFGLNLLGGGLGVLGFLKSGESSIYFGFLKE